MTFLYSARSVVAICLTSCVALAAAGCGTGDYEKIFEKKRAELDYLAPFTALHPEPVDVPEAAFKIRLPKEFGNQKFTKGSPHPDDASKKITLPRLRPTYLNGAGKAFTSLTDMYEQMLDAPNSGKTPWACYLGGWKTPADGGKQFAAQVLTALRANKPDPSPAWEERDCKTPERDANGTAKTVRWQRVAGKVDQTFEHLIFGSETKAEQGRVNCEVWLYQDQGYTVIVAWSLPDEVDSKLPNFSRLTELTAGTITFDPNVEPAADKPAAPKAGT